MAGSQHTDSGYVLHRRRYRETSLIVDFLTCEHGRVGAVARGALRSNSRLASALQPLIPLDLAFSGRSDLLTLLRAEARASPSPLQGERLYCLFYLNELIMRMTAVHDPNPRLYGVYENALAGLLASHPIEPVLRQFEVHLLEALGLGLQLVAEAGNGAPLQADGDYLYVIDRGPLRRTSAIAGIAVKGATLLALAGRGALSADVLQQAKSLMRQVLNHHLDGRPLASRKLFEAHAGGKP